LRFNRLLTMGFPIWWLRSVYDLGARLIESVVTSVHCLLGLM
jgi:hypothetical protein